MATRPANISDAIRAIRQKASVRRRLWEAFVRPPRRSEARQLHLTRSSVGARPSSAAPVEQDHLNKKHETAVQLNLP